MKPPIQLDKQYKTRDGREVRIHAIDGPKDKYPVIGSIKYNNNSWDAYTFTQDGSFVADQQSATDLIEVIPLWEGEVWVRGKEYQFAFPQDDHEWHERQGWRKIKVKQEEPT